MSIENKKTEKRLMGIALITGFGFMFLFFNLAHNLVTFFF